MNFQEFCNIIRMAYGFRGNQLNGINFLTRRATVFLGPINIVKCQLYLNNETSGRSLFASSCQFALYYVRGDIVEK